MLQRVGYRLARELMHWYASNSPEVNSPLAGDLVDRSREPTSGVKAEKA